MFIKSSTRNSHLILRKRRYSVMMSLMHIYHIIALLKIGLWGWVMLLMYFLINPELDPVLAYTGIFSWLLLFVWGISFYIFWWVHSLWTQRSLQDIIVPSYKLSLLLGLFIVINTVLFFLHYWTRELGLLLLLIFVGLFALLYKQEYNVQLWKRW